MLKGKTQQIIGPVVDVEFPEGQTPAIYDALEVVYESTQMGKQMDTDKKLVLEVAQQLGYGVVRCIALGPTDGLKRRMEVKTTGNYHRIGGYRRRIKGPKKLVDGRWNIE